MTTKKNIENIITRAKKWSDSRGISKQSPTIEDFVANITEEAGEYLSGAKKKITDEIIDAVADKAVFTITEMFKYGIGTDDLFTFFRDYDEAQKYNLKLNDNSRNSYNLSVIRTIGEMSKINSIETLSHLIGITFCKMTTLGYEPLKVMDEVLKVVESRVGSWDEDNGKFQKDMSPEAQANWYTPNYESCRL